jgi:integrase/recombinase XerC/integrase/recombinase XerD
MTRQQAGNILTKLAEEADIKPYLEDGSRGSPEDVHTHALRHSLAYRMLSSPDSSYGIYDTKRRLRHRSVTTTERHYSHFDVV